MSRSNSGADRWARLLSCLATILLFACAGLLQVRAQTLAGAEYFWDTDPGAGSGVAVTAPAAESLVLGQDGVPALDVDVSGLSVGLHRLGYRVRDGAGRWSEVVWLPVEVFDIASVVGAVSQWPSGSAPKSLAAAEYFWDTDPGPGSGVAVATSTTETLVLGQDGVPSLNLDMTSLSAGLHQLGYRVRDVSGRWSEVTWVPVEIETTSAVLGAVTGWPAASASGRLVAAEYFWDTDPGLGSATVVSVAAAESLILGQDGVPLLDLDATGLSLGVHELGYRVRDGAGRWSETTRLSVEVQSGAPIIQVNGVVSSTNRHDFLTHDEVEVSISTLFPGGSVYYTLDGSEPDFASTPYTVPFRIAPPASVRAVAYDSDLVNVEFTGPVELVFIPSYTLTDTTPGGGGVVFDPPGGTTVGTYASNTVVSVTATNLAGWTFMRWEGDASGTGTNTTVTMNRAKTLRAVFGAGVSTVVTGGAANGSVVKSPDAALYPYGTLVRLSAVPTSTKYFFRWTPTNYLALNPLTLTLTNTGLSATAQFANLGTGNRTLTVMIDGGGTVTRSPESLFYASGTSVTLTPVPDNGWIFSSWSGAVTGADNPLSLNMDASKVVTATFVATGGEPPSINLEPIGQTNVVGSTITMEVTATGTAPLRYQWKKDNQNLLDATNAVLSVSNATSANDGEYHVVVSNSAGSVPSRKVQVRLVLPARFLPGLVSWWPADGNANDLFAGRDGSLGNGATFVVDGRSGQAFSFNGAGSVVQLPSFTQTELTVALWFRTSSSGYLWDKNFNGSGYNLPFLLTVDPGGTVSLGMGTGAADGPAWITSSRSYNDNQWHHVSASYDGRDMVLYLDGRFEARLLFGRPMLQSGQPVALGRWSGADAGFYAGSIDEVALYDRAISPVDIASVYRFGVDGRIPGGSAPFIFEQPLSGVVNAGSDVSLHVGAVGQEPLSYQWLFNGQPIPEATSPTLTLTRAQPRQTGNYSVRVSNADGADTSQVARVEIETGFTSVTSGPVVSDGQSAFGAGWVDYDQDGWPDLIIANGNNFGGQPKANNLFYHNNRDGTFGVAPGSPVNQTPGYYRGVVAADFNNDGRPDIYVQGCCGAGTANQYFQNLGNGQFRSVDAGAFTAAYANSQSAAVADYDRDGFLDVFVSNYGAGNMLFRNQGDGLFALASGAVSSGVFPTYGSSWADYDNDGWPDLFIANFGQANRLYRNQRDGSFVEASSGALTSDVAFTKSVAWADFDNDGDLDVIVMNGNGGEPVLYRNDLGSYTRLASSVLGMPGGEYSGVAWGDYDNDGFIDVILTGTDFTKLLRNRGDGTFALISTSAATRTNTSGGGEGAAAVSWVDYDRDGFLDLYVGQSGNDLLLHNSGNSNHWLRVRCVTAEGGRDAIGAKVRVTSVVGGSSVTQRRDITAGEGYFGQSEPVAHFGLGDATTVAALRVEWPSGQVMTLTNVAVNQHLTLTELPVKLRRSLLALVPGAHGAFEVLPGTNQFTYQWRFQGNNLVGETNRVLAFPSATIGQAGDYSVLLSDGNRIAEVFTRLDVATGLGVEQIARWGFEGNYQDSTGFGNHAIPEGGVRFMDGVQGQGIQFVARGDDVRVPTSESINIGTGPGFTISMWIRPDSLLDAQALAEWAPIESGRWRLHFFIQSNYLVEGLRKSLWLNLGGATQASAESSAVLTEGEYQLVTVTYDRAKGEARFYRNGLGAGTAKLGSVEPDAAGDLYLGTRLYSNRGNDFVGFMDEVGVWRRALSEAEVAALYSLQTTEWLKITQHPTGITNWAGSTITLSVAAAGVGPISYQWYHGGTPILGATESNLVLTSVRPKQSGSYTVRVFNPLAAVTSSVAQVQITWPTQLSAADGGALTSSGGFTVGFGVADLNGDGTNDVFLPNYGDTPSVMLFGQAHGSFLKNDGFPALFAGNAFDTPYVPVFADYDNDGDLDLYLPFLQGSDGGPTESRFYRNEGAGVFTRLSGLGPLTDSKLRSGSAAWGDLDRDGFVDLVVAYRDLDTLGLYRNNGNGTFTDRSFPLGGGIGGLGSLALGDFDGDGWLDVLGVESKDPGARVQLLRNLEGFTFSEVSTHGINPGPRAFTAQWIDYDNDGRLDVWCLGWEGPGRLWRNNGDSTFAPIHEQEGTSTALADFNLDGQIDIASGNFQMAADLNHDGLPDLLGSGGRGVDGRSESFVTNVWNGASWLTVRPLGRASNRAGIGARLWVTSVVDGREVTQTRIISSGGGYPISGPLEAYFGLGDATNITTLRAEWPSGLVTELHDVAPNQILTVEELPVGTPVVRVDGTFSATARHEFLTHDEVEVTIQTSYPGGVIYYSTDGTAPDYLSSSSVRYTGPFRVRPSATIHAIAYDGDPLVLYNQERPLGAPVELVYVPSYTLTDTTPGGGVVLFDSPGGTYRSNTVVQVTAQAAAGWQFMRWEGAASGTESTTSVRVDRALEVRAVFGTELVSRVSGTGGVVTNSPASGPYAYGSRLWVSAVPAADKFFSRWTVTTPSSTNQVLDLPLVLTVTNAFQTNTAFFGTTGTGRALTLFVKGPGAIERSPSQIGSYTANQVVTLTPRPDPGWVFSGWSGDATGTQNPLNLTLNTSKTVTATFASETQGVSIRSPGNGTEFALPSTITIEAGLVDFAATRVEFFDGLTKLGETLAGPFHFIWNNATEGNHSLTAKATDATGAVHTSTPVVIRVSIPPTISVQPQHRTVVVGANAEFSVSAEGTAPLSYQWRTNGVDLAGANAATYALTATSAMRGTTDYTVVVANSVGRSTSAVAVLTVSDLPPQTITFAPLANRNLTNSPFVLSATSSAGLPVSFSLVSGPARLTNDVLHLTGAGTVTVRASQAGSPSVAPAQSVDQTFTVGLPAAAEVRADQGQSVTITPGASSVAGLVYAIERHPASGAVVVDDNRLVYTPVPSFYGLVDFAYRITDPVSGVQTSGLAVNVVVLGVEATFSLDKSTYSVGEGAGFVLVTIRKNVSKEATVNLTLIDASAKLGPSPEGDYTSQVNSLAFASGETSKLLSISINPDEVFEGDEFFELEISAANPSTVAGVTKATITIVDDDSDLVSKLFVEPGPEPEHTGRLQMELMPPGVAGLWRFVGQRQWSTNTAISEGMPAGDYEIEFKPVNGFAHPLPISVTLTNNLTTNYTAYYIPTSTSRVGDLKIELTGTALGGWKFVEEPDSAYRPSGTTLVGLNAGVYTVQLKPVDGLLTPGNMNVEVKVIAPQTYTAAYAPAPPANSVRTKPAVTATTDLNYKYVGEISRGDGELGTGFVVNEHVVLTAGHVLLDSRTLGPAKRVRWHFQRQRGVYEPRPQIPRGWNLYAGYAAQRTNDGVHFPSTPLSQNLDAAAMFFTEPAGRGGYSGYLASTNSPNEWLSGTEDKVITGYPIDGIPSLDQGKIHETPQRRVRLTKVAGLTEGHLYSSSELLSYPGNSGGPLSVLYSGKFYPAAIFVASDADRIYLRALDHKIVQMINSAELSGRYGTNATGGGVPKPPAPHEEVPDEIGSIQVTVVPTEAIDAGAGWRVVNGNPDYVTTSPKLMDVLTFGYELEFKEANGFATPAKIVVQGVAGTTNDLVVRYKRTQTLSFPAIANQTLGVGPLRLGATASSGLPTAYEVVTGPATLSGEMLTLNAAGTVTVRARQDGNDDFAAAVSMERTFVVSSVTSTTRTISGTVSYYNSGIRVPGVEVTLSGDAARTVTTGTDGSYSFTVAAPGNYTVTPSKLFESPPVQGVSTLDITFIRRQILGIAPLDSAYKQLAADVNNSATVSTLDLTHMRRMILGVTNNLPSGLWRFVRSDQTFADVKGPWDAEGRRVYAAVNADLVQQDFTAVRMGDANGSWTVPNPTPQGLGPLEPGRSGVTASVGPMFRLPELEVPLTSGLEIDVPVTATGFKSVTSVQFSMGWDSSILEFVKVLPAQLVGVGEGSFNLGNTAKGRISFSWDDPEGVGQVLSEKQALFVLRFRISQARSPAVGAIEFLDKPTAREVSMDYRLIPWQSGNGALWIGVQRGSLRAGIERRGETGINLVLPMLVGADFLIEGSDQLVGSEWRSMGAVVSGDGTAKSVALPLDLKRNGFYRFRVLPRPLPSGTISR